jgi:glycerol-3-phosphate dehydrogenase subunit B
MKDSAHYKYDLVIIGTGLAGMAAAVYAANRGISTALVGSLGESWFTGGLIDLMGVHPIGNSTVWRDPWAAIEAVVEDIPGHPYARLSRKDIQEAIQELFSFFSEAGLTYRFQNDQNSSMVTAFGATKTTYGVPQTMWPGVMAYSRKVPCLIVDLQGLKGSSARLLAERLTPEWPDLKILSLPSFYSQEAHEINPVPLAQDLEVAEYRQKLADLIGPHAKDIELVGLPAVLGIHQSEKIVQEISEMVGKPVFEIPAMPPSIPGLRLKEAFIRFLPAKGTTCLFQKHVLKATLSPNREFLLDIGRTEKETQIRANGLLLATGRFLGGGLQSDHKAIKESIFNLPVYQPGDRSRWHQDRFFDPTGHAVNQAGLETDHMLRPLNDKGQPAFENLFAAGIILAHQDWARMKCGSGLSAATAYGAVKSFIGLRNE